MATEKWIDMPGERLLVIIPAVSRMNEEELEAFKARWMEQYKGPLPVECRIIGINEEP